MTPTKLTPKELKDSELIEIHKGLYTKLINDNVHNLRNKKLCLKLYDKVINTENIRLYYNRHISIFAQALLTNNLSSIVKHSTH